MGQSGRRCRVKIGSRSTPYEWRACEVVQQLKTGMRLPESRNGRGGQLPSTFPAIAPSPGPVDECLDFVNRRCLVPVQSPRNASVGIFAKVFLLHRLSLNFRTMPIRQNNFSLYHGSLRYSSGGCDWKLGTV